MHDSLRLIKSTIVLSFPLIQAMYRNRYEPTVFISYSLPYMSYHIFQKKSANQCRVGLCLWILIKIMTNCMNNINTIDLVVINDQI